MDDDTRKLLSGIGQPDFAYREFNAPDGDALLDKWPLLGLVARLPEMRPTALATRAAAARTPVAAPRDAGSFLDTYQPTQGRGDAPAADIRNLFERLSESQR